MPPNDNQHHVLMLLTYISGVCFESGGYNIKWGLRSEVELMKYDMGGMGAALGAALAIGDLKPTGVEVIYHTQKVLLGIS